MLYQCESDAGAFGPPSGDLVRNTWVTCPGVGDTRPKGRLIPHALPPRGAGGKLRFGGARWEGPAAYQLVGGVTAHRGGDG